MARAFDGRVRAVFFDLDDTLAGYRPGPEDLLVDACRDFGLDITPRDARRGWLAAGVYWRRSVAQRPFGGRTEAQLQALYVEFDRRLLVAAGLPVGGRLAYRIFTRLLELLKAAGSRKALYDDALPALAALKAAGLTLGVVSNVAEGLDQVCHDLGLSPWLDVVIGPEEAGVSKPDPRIFRTALHKISVPPRDAVHVGDNPLLDAAGARRAGLRPVLLDRYDVFPGFLACPRAVSLKQVVELVTGNRPAPTGAGRGGAGAAGASGGQRITPSLRRR